METSQQAQHSRVSSAQHEAHRLWLKIIQAREPVGPGPEDKKSLMHPDWLVIDDTKARSNACLSSGDHVARLTPPLCKQSVTYAQKKCRQKTQKTHQ